jgi:antitoxin component HigA of HigAB toxin-antitoxin module
MNTPADPAPIETLDEYHRYIAELDGLMRLDPDPETPEGVRLLALVDAIEVFERKAWPSMFPEMTPEQARSLIGE